MTPADNTGIWTAIDWFYFIPLLHITFPFYQFMVVDIGGQQHDDVAWQKLLVSFCEGNPVVADELLISQRGSNAELWPFLLFVRASYQTNNRVAGDFRNRDAILMNSEVGRKLRFTHVSRNNRQNSMCHRPNVFVARLIFARVLTVEIP